MFRYCLVALLLTASLNLVRSETINIVMNDVQVPLVEIHVPGYEAATGNKVNLVSFKSFGELLDQIQADLRKGSPFYDAFVFLGQTKSELILCSECDPEQRPLIAPLTELIRNDPALQWNDVAVFQRSTNSAFDGDIYTVPVDGDFHYMYYRKDILEKFGLDVPQTWDDFINVMQTVHGQDLNGDGIPDYGACVETKNQTGWIPSSYFIWTIAAPMLQSKGTKQGLFFDATTMEIMANTTAFRTAAQILREIARHSPIEDIRNLWTEGRCALALDWGDIAVRSQLNISVVANVTGMSLTPGSRTVYNRDTQQMEECTQELCPHMDSFGLNRAPYAAALGWTMAISRFIPDSRLHAAYDFLSYVSQPSHSIESVLLGLGWDLVRDSQMNPQIFLDVGFSNLTATTMINSNKGAQNSLNAVADLPLEKYSEYTLALGEKLSQFLYDEISLDEFQASTVAAWDALLDKYGRREQHVAYALFIGAPRPMFDYEVTLPDALRIAFVAISGVCIAIALGLVVFIVIHRNKKIIRGTSPTFHYTTLGGATLIFLSVLLFSIPPTSSPLCMSSMWLFALGFGFIYGSIFVKLYRLWRLSTKSLLIKKITDAKLFPFLGGILAVYIALLVAWTIVDPPVASQYRQSLESDQFMMVCQTGGSGIIIFAIILGWSCVLLLVGIVLSFLTRNLAEAYNESKPVSLSVYIYSFSAVILIPILFTVPNALVVFIVTDAVLVFSTLVTLIALYLSKIVRIKKGLGDKVTTGLSTSMTPPTSTAPMSNTGSMAVPDSNRKIELENQLLRERIADLEKQLRARPEY